MNGAAASQTAKLAGARWRWGQGVRVALPALLLVAAEATVLAESGLVDELPRVTLSPPGGVAPAPPPISLRVDSRWACRYGYRPVEFTFTCPVASTADRSITVAYAVNTGSRRRARMVAEQDVDLPAGATSATLTIAAPQLTTQQEVSWKVWIDGRYERSLSRPTSGALQQPPGPGAGLHFLHVGPRLAGVNAAGNKRLPLPVLRTITGTPLEGTQAPLPDRWVLYSGLDLVIADVDDLVAAAEDRPEALAALRRWVSTGGALWIADAGAEFRRLEQVSELVDLPPATRLTALTGAVGPVPELPAWQWVAPPARQDGGNEQQKDEPDASLPTLTPWYAEARLGLGVVGAFDTETLGAARGAGWLQRLAPLRGARPAFMRRWMARNWVERHGLAPDAANASFSNLLPEGAGRAPVTVFRVLVTLFVLVVGPLNFWLLRRRQRAQLMVLTVPLMAAGLTAALFGYAILAEGFGVQARVRSVTLIDQHRGEQTAWSRVCYYAGAAPGDGLVFPDTTAAYPIMPGWNDPGEVAAFQRVRSVDWRDGEQRLQRGWLPSREVTQLLAVHAGPTEAAIRFRDDGGGLLATNRLGADAALLVVIDERGDYWMAEGVAAGAETPLVRAELLDAVAKVRTLVSENTPTPPPGMESAADNAIVEAQRRQQRRKRRNLGIDYSSVALNQNLLNREIARIAGIDGSKPLDLRPRTYLALTEETGWLPLGVDGLRERSSFHVVLGSW